MNRNKEQEKTVKIFALVADNQVYVSKTVNHDLSAVYRHHTRGRCGFTKDTVIANSKSTVGFYVLEEITVCTSVAYRHVVAWTRIFADAGYTILNPEGTQHHAKNLHPETQRLVDQLRSNPLSTILASTQYPFPRVDTTEVASYDDAEDQGKKNLAKYKLTIRLTPEEYTSFASLAERLYLTQRDTLMYLLNARNAAGHSNDAIIEAQQHLFRKINALRKENEKLADKIVRLKASPEAAAPRMTQRLSETKDAITEYFRHIDTPAAPNLPRLAYKRYAKMFPSLREFQYLDQNEPFIFTPTALLYGNANPPVYFWIGHTDGNVPCKIRVYQKSDFVGISPFNENFSHSGTKWLVQTRTAADSAEDLIFALPFITTPKTETTYPEKPSLVRQIASAQTKK